MLHAVLLAVRERGLDDLLARVPRAPGAPGREPAGREPPRERLRLEGFYKRLDTDEEWWRMFRPEQIFLDAHLRLPPGSRNVQHCTRECRFNHAVSALPSLLFFRDGAKMNPIGLDWVHTYVDEPHVLAGSTLDRLASALDVAAGPGPVRPPAVHLATTCLPELIGEHPRGTVRDFERRTGVRVFWTSKTLGNSDSYRDWLAAALRDVAWMTPRDPSAVVLAGVIDGPDRAEIARLLGDMGLEVAASLLPALDVAASPRLASAGAVVWGGGATDWESVGPGLFSPHLPEIRPPAPIGTEGMLAFVDAVASALAPDRRDACLDRVRDELEQGLGPLREAARRVTVGLIGDAADVSSMRVPGLVPFPIARVVRELGFRVLLGVNDPGDGAADRVAPAASADEEIATFRTPADLDALLRDRVDVALSHFARDPRLDAHGIRGFDESIFGAGPAGAVRAARTLLSLASRRWPAGFRRFLRPWVRR
jgi:hypothetical protein